MSQDLQRYSVIHEKNPREILLLRGNGCKYRKCAFCDYHDDFHLNQNENDVLNTSILAQVTGIYPCLEVINSGSFCDLSQTTHQNILSTCLTHKITQLIFEAHWLHRNEVSAIKEFYQAHNIQVKIKIGVETFDYYYREQVLLKGITEKNPDRIAKYFDQCCLLHGLRHQTVSSMKNDIEVGLQHFSRVCVNIMIENSSSIKPDPQVIEQFNKHIYPIYMDNPRVDILLHNTDFGVGGNDNE